MRIRILWLILLTMAVTALPVSARSAAARVQAEEKTSAASAPKAEQKNSDNKDDQPKIRVAPSIDLWDGGSARTLTGNAAFITIPALFSYDAGVRLAPTESWPHASTLNRVLPEEREQRFWLTCRYAHAPPLIG